MNKEVMQRIAQHYVYDTQSRRCIEEMEALANAINESFRNKGESYSTALKRVTLKDNIIEKIADVQIMLWQLEYLLNVDIEPMIEQKINRQLERMEKIGGK